MTDLSLRITGEDNAATVRNALEAAASERGAELNTTHGPPADDEISLGEAVVDVSEAYTGWTP